MGVQSAVDRLDTPDPLPGARLYAVLAVQQVKSEARLLKPVDETRLTRQLVVALDTRGFHLADDEQIPEILLTVQYGRGWLKNPYRSNIGNLSVDVPGLLPESSVTGTSDKPAPATPGVKAHFMNGLSRSYEEEVQKATYEKLFVRVSAWVYPTDPTARAQRLWHTTIVVDDPDHRDLNAITSQMFAAGAPYFDRATEQNQVSVFMPAADAQVKVGNPVVVGELPVPPGRAPAPAVPVVAAVPAAVLKRFDLPAGEAVTSLQAFSRQSGEEIIYPADQVQAVRTQAVSGEFSARTALERMLDQTGLVAEWDEKSGICIIRHAAH